MQADAFQFTRLDDGQKRRSPHLHEAVRSPDLTAETWLFVSPHDDDLCLGAGLWLQAAARAGVNVRILIVTDGSQGYCTLEQKDRIVEIRRDETIESFGILGIAADAVRYVGYPDGGLFIWQGRRPGRPGEPDLAGHVGLQNAFTHHLRLVRPQRVFVPTATDLHPDHQITHNELMISIFHASGEIWPELGEPLDEPPMVYEMAVYCDFAHPPNLELQAGQNPFETKLRSIAAYRSQVQIQSVIDQHREAGAYEYLHEMRFGLYSPDHYKPRFA